MDFETTVGFLKQDLNAKSPEHYVRLVIGTLICGIGCVDVFIHVITQSPWEQNSLIVALGMVFGGAGIMFTKSVVALAKALLPWGKKNGNA